MDDRDPLLVALVDATIDGEQVHAGRSRWRASCIPAEHAHLFGPDNRPGPARAQRSVEVRAYGGDGRLIEER
jgi:hypothetical protein